jgi:hypothetical protein
MRSKGTARSQLTPSLLRSNYRQHNALANGLKLNSIHRICNMSPGRELRRQSDAIHPLDQDVQVCNELIAASTFFNSNRNGELSG